MVRCTKNLLTTKEINCLLEYMKIEDERSDRRPDVYSKHPRWDIDIWPQDIVKKVLDQILDYDYLVEEIIFNESIISFRLHADSGDGNVKKLGHAILIPLMVEGKGTTVFFNNYWHGPSTRFTRVPNSPFEYRIPYGDGMIYYTPDLRELLQEVQQGKVPAELQHMKDLEATLAYLVNARQGNKISKPDERMADYTKIKNFDPDNVIDPAICQEYLNHVPHENLYGLSIDKIIEWVPGDAIVFDRKQIHSAGSGHSRKIGITIFTQRA